MMAVDGCLAHQKEDEIYSDSSIFTNAQKRCMYRNMLLFLGIRVHLLGSLGAVFL